MSSIVGQRVGFGITPALGHFDPERLVEDVRRAEALGYEMFSISDHLHTEHPTYEPWTALTWVAAATERITVMPNVLGLPYRAPAVVAKMAETLDRLSGGRLVLGLGGGGYDEEFSAFGIRVGSGGEKISALGEAGELIRGLWSKSTVTFEGRNFRLRDARIEPKPAHSIPIWLGTYRPRALRLTGTLADGWIPSFPRLELDEAVAMRTAVRAAAEAAGRDPDEITCAANIVVAFDPSRTPTSQFVAGSSEAIAGQLAAIVRAGFTFLNAMFPEADSRRRLSDTRERFATEVIPLVHDDLAGS